MFNQITQKKSLLLFPGLLFIFAAAGGTFFLKFEVYSKLQLTMVSLLPLLFLTLWVLLRERMIVASLEDELKTLLTSMDLPETRMSKGLDDFVEKLKKVIRQNIEIINKSEERNEASETAVRILEYKRSRLEAVLTGYPDGIMVLDESGMPTFANSKVSNLTGISSEKVIGKNFREWADDKDISAFFARYHGSKGRLLRAEKMEFVPASSPNLTIMAGAYPLFSGDGEAESFGTLLVFRDITAEKMAQKARGDFVSHVSHELKSPLNVLAMYSEMLLSEDGKTESFRIEAVNVIHDEVERLALLINNLLSISQIEMGSLAVNLQRVKLLDLLKDAFESQTRYGREQGISFNLDLPASLSPLSLDKALFKVAVNNLLTNAIKYNKKNGSVTLQAKETEKRILIMVKDTGIGISAEDQESIFEKFFRSENKMVREKSGHGIGLSLAKIIIELHHGKLLLESDIQKGSTFTIVFEKTGGLLREGI